MPLLLFAYREIPVETLGFSPFEMLFGYSVRGPLELLKSAWKPTSLTKSKPKRNVLQYILGVREKLNVCRELALTHAKEEKVKSKTWYDRKALERSFEPEQLVLVCLPSMGHPLETKYVGPYRIMERLGPVDYLISTPDRRKTQRICHVNMLKAYVTRDATLFPPQTINMTSVSLTIPVDEKEVITDFGPSAYDKDVGDIQGDLSPDQRSEIDQLLAKYAKTFDDKPGRTNLCKHVIELQPNTKPIRMAPYRVNPQKASLNNLLRKGVRFTWTPETESSFLDLKSRLVSRPILRPPNFKQPFSRSVDASGVAIGACLFQTIDGVEHPVCYYSRKLDIHQQRYSTVEREALGLVLAVRVFSVYFGSQPTTVYTDHSPLQFIQRMANVNNKLLRWSLELQQYNLKIVHRAGKDNLLPDILSRPPQ